MSKNTHEHYQIWKYLLKIKPEQTISVPQATPRFKPKPLKVIIQDGKLHLSVLVNPDIKTREKLTVYLYKTGDPIYDWLAEEGKYVDSFQIPGVSFVGHIFVR